MCGFLWGLTDKHVRLVLPVLDYNRLAKKILHLEGFSEDCQESIKHKGYSTMNYLPLPNFWGKTKKTKKSGKGEMLFLDTVSICEIFCF